MNGRKGLKENQKKGLFAFFNQIQAPNLFFQNLKNIFFHSFFILFSPFFLFLPVFTYFSFKCVI